MSTQGKLGQNSYKLKLVNFFHPQLKLLD